jgi:hypothetical protein
MPETAEKKIFKNAGQRCSICHHNDISLLTRRAGKTAGRRTVLARVYDQFTLHDDLLEAFGCCLKAFYAL